jgi:hypothetical protein
MSRMTWAWGGFWLGCVPRTLASCHGLDLDVDIPVQLAACDALVKLSLDLCLSRCVWRVSWWIVKIVFVASRRRRPPPPQHFLVAWCLSRSSPGAHARIIFLGLCVQTKVQSSFEPVSFPAEYVPLPFQIKSFLHTPHQTVYLPVTRHSGARWTTSTVPGPPGPGLPPGPSCTWTRP